VTRPRVVVLDHGSGNLRSAERALARAGADVTVTGDTAAALDSDGLVVPGVGAFAAVMAGLTAVDGVEVVGKRLAAGRPVLGICVGMQVLFDEGVERGVRTRGLGAWPGVVGELEAPVLPHIGWNTVEVGPGSALFRGVEGERFYFVHSYAATAFATPDTATPDTAAPDPSARPPAVTWAVHGSRFVAAVEDGPLWATQFHPEKSGEAGSVLLANWLEGLR
jgi:glutamine amidotransferase